MPRGRRRPAHRLPPVEREYEIIDWIHEAIDEGAGIIINPAAFTFTSIAILDALKMFPGPIIELHISQHPPPRADLPQILCLAGGDRRHRRPRRQRLSGRGPCAMLDMIAKASAKA